MLEFIDPDKNLSKEVYQQVFPDLEERLARLQREARASGVPVVVVFEGWDAAGKGTIINRLTRSLDPRGFKVHPIGPPDDVERHFPWMHRFWKLLPAAGSMGIFDRSWYGRVLVERVDRPAAPGAVEQALDDIRELERQWCDSGVVLVKFFLHITRGEQHRRFTRLERQPALAWKVGRAEWKQNRRYNTWRKAVEEMLQQTSTDEAPWTVVEAHHGRFVRAKVYQTLCSAIATALQQRQEAAAAVPAVAEDADRPAADAHGALAASPLDRVDLAQILDRATYDRRLKALQRRLVELEHELYTARVPAIVAYEGWDAAGKGGNIRRLTDGLDPRGYEVVPVAAPSVEEKARHYLWRFWRAVPKAGHITIFDRTWYGRVLVERVEGFCTPHEWRRAYREINQFERQFCDFGGVLVKFWLHIDPDEQLRRFQDRQENPAKRWKITDEDWRNRQRWPDYYAAVTDMLQRTSTSYAPWTVLEANCKLHARVQALETVVAALERRLGEGDKHGRKKARTESAASAIPADGAAALEWRHEHAEAVV